MELNIVNSTSLHTILSQETEGLVTPEDERRLATSSIPVERIVRDYIEQCNGLEKPMVHEIVLLGIMDFARGYDLGVELIQFGLEPDWYPSSTGGIHLLVRVGNTMKPAEILVSSSVSSETVKQLRKYTGDCADVKYVN